MLIPSLMSAVKTVRAMALLGALAVGLTVGAPGRARAQASPFAGDYITVSGADQITVSDTGRFTGYSGLSGLSGRIADDGRVTLTMTVFLGGDGLGGRKGKPPTAKATGVATLDELGNMYWLLHWDSGLISEVYWLPSN
jgi:hypothetical protein